MWIVLDFLPDSWKYESKTFTKRISNLTYDNIVIKLNQEMEHRIQSIIKRSSKSMNSFPLMNKMSRISTMREFAEREYPIHPTDE